MRKKKQAKPKHLLIAVYDCLGRYGAFFRDRICEECRFSLSTFYRKKRGIDMVIDGKLVQVLTGAENRQIRELVIELRDLIVGELNHLIRMY